MGKKIKNPTLIAYERCVLTWRHTKAESKQMQKSRTESVRCRYSVQSRPGNKESFQRQWEEHNLGGRRAAAVIETLGWYPPTESSLLLPQASTSGGKKSEINRDDLSHRLKRLPKFPEMRKTGGQPSGCLYGGCSWWGDVESVTPSGGTWSAAWAPQDLDLHPHHHTAVRRFTVARPVPNKYPTCTIPFMPPFSPMRSKLWMGKWARESFQSPVQGHSLEAQSLDWQGHWLSSRACALNTTAYSLHSS